MQVMRRYLLDRSWDPSQQRRDETRRDETGYPQMLWHPIVNTYIMVDFVIVCSAQGIHIM